MISIPKVEWQRVSLKDNTEYQAALARLVEDNRIMVHPAHHDLDLDYSKEMRQIIAEIKALPYEPIYRNRLEEIW